MGDRTYVTLTVLKSQEKEAMSLFCYDPDEDWFEDQFSYFGFAEVNYGTLSFLSDLQAAGIAYDSRWEQGGDYEPGSESLRFSSSGEAIVKAFNDSAKNPDLSALVGLIDKPEDLKKYILKHHEEVSCLPWENQEEYGKLYRAKQLISS